MKANEAFSIAFGLLYIMRHTKRAIELISLSFILLLTTALISGMNTIINSATQTRSENTVEDKVYNAMKEAGKPVRPGDIAKSLDVDSKEISKAIKALREDGKVVSPKRCYYEPA